MKKIFLFIACLVLTSAWLAYAQAQSPDNTVTPDAPTPPTFTCGNPTTNPNYYQCYNNVYAPALREYQFKLDGYNKSRATAGGGSFQVADTGMVNTPAAPVNNCGPEPVSTSAQHSSWTSCQGTYNSNMHNYQESMSVYNEVNTGLQQSNFSAAQNQANIEANNLRAVQSDSPAGTIDQAQKKTSTGKTIFRQVAGVLGAVAIVKYTAGMTNAAACSSQCYSCCAKAAASFAAAAVFNGLMNKADNQSSNLAAMEQALCEKKNQISSQQQNCFAIQDNPNPYSSPNANSSNNNQSNWIDPDTGRCRTTAPPECQARQNAAREMGVTLPRIDAQCAGGGTACMANGYKPIVIETPKGKKHTIKTKDGKEFSFYESDLTSASALMAGGMSAKDAKAFADEMNNIVETISKKEAAAKKAAEENSLAGLSGGMDSKLNFGAGMDPNAAGGADGSKTYKDDLKAVNDKDRKPTSEGLSKDFHGDLIGSAGDSIFLMMNRRYQLKSEQDTFITPE